VTRVHDTIIVTSYWALKAATWWKLQWSNRASVHNDRKKLRAQEPPRFHRVNTWTVFFFCILLADWRRSTTISRADGKCRRDRKERLRLSSKCTMTFVRHSIGMTRVSNLKSSYEIQKPPRSLRHFLSLSFHGEFSFIFIMFARFGWSRDSTRGLF